MQVSKNLSLNTFNIQRTCVHDGPGIRSTIFFKGCNLRCIWCQNPEMQSFDDKVASDFNYTIDEITEIVLRDIDYYSPTNGGITLSGGEPLLQDPDSLIYLLESLKKEKIKISVETSLHAPWKNISKILPYVDLFLVDLKLVGDEDLHLTLTKQKSTLIHENLQKLLKTKANIKFRMVMVPGLNDTEANIKATSELLKSINYDHIELMKYHNLYEDKATRLGLDIERLHITPEQSIESLQKGAKLFSKHGIEVESTSLETASHKTKTKFTPRVKKIQRDIRGSPRAVCIETSKLKTKYYRKFKGFKKPTPIHRAERLAYMLNNKNVII